MNIWRRFYNYFNPPDPKLTFVRGTKRTGYEGKIIGWQARELAITEDYTLHSGKESIGELQVINKWVNKIVTYERDIIGYNKRDFWESSQQVRERQKADCDGYTTYKMWLMRQVELPDHKIMGVIWTNKDSGHMMAGYQFSKDDFYCLDNGYMTEDIIKASELFSSNNCHGMKPRAWFNMFGYGSF